MKLPFWTLRQENRAKYEEICRTKIASGKYALNLYHKEILKYIGSFPPANGCWEATRRIHEKIGGDRKTFSMSLRYLMAIGAISREAGGRQAFHLAIPKTTVISQCEWRKNMNVTSYVRNNGHTTNGSFFYNDHGVIFPKHEENHPIETGKITPHFIRDYKYLTSNKNTMAPPKPPLVDDIQPVEFDGRALRDHEVGRQSGRPAPEGCRLLDESPLFLGEDKMNFESQGDVLMAKKKTTLRPKDDSEPLAPAPRGRFPEPKTQRERESAAAALSRRGHIANPLGGPNLKTRRVCPKRARDIAPTGAVTTAQLYKFLCQKYSEAFGPGILEGQLPSDRSALEASFDQLKQKFIDQCKHDASNRDLAEYFAWLLSPENAHKLVGAGMKQGYAAWQQLCGRVYVQKFYDDNLRGRSSSAAAQKVVEITVEDADAKNWRLAKTLIEEAFAAFERALTKDEMAYKLTQYGFVAYGWFLSDCKHMDAEEAREHIINQLAVFLRGSTEINEAIEYIRMGYAATIKNKSILKFAPFWKDPEACKEFVDCAVKRSGVKA